MMQYLKHIVLFLLTLLTTTVAGLIWQNDYDLSHFSKGLPYSLSLLFILSCHEFGHYFAARHHKVNVTLPFYIPFPPILISFGTFGAVIRTRQIIPSRKAIFDIGIAGPIAGFVASMFVLAVGFLTLPGKEFLLGIHPDYNFATGTIPNVPEGNTLVFGSTLLYKAFQFVFAKPGAYVPPMTEMYHYPFLITGWFGLLVTSLNLLPAGQLDGGHILYAMLDKYHRTIGRITAAVLACMGFIGSFPAIAELLKMGNFSPISTGNLTSLPAIFWPGWLFWALLIMFVIKTGHPTMEDHEPLTPNRKLIGCSAIVMFVLCFSPAPIYFAP